MVSLLFCSISNIRCEVGETIRLKSVLFYNQDRKKEMKEILTEISILLVILEDNSRYVFSFLRTCPICRVPSAFVTPVSHSSFAVSFSIP